jgi:vacuolar-type H+-ATPase subunit H
MLGLQVTCGRFVAVAAGGRIYHRRVSENPQPPAPSTAAAAADRVATIVAAAEQTAARLRAEAEEQVRARIAEGQRAGEYRVAAAEDEALAIVAKAEQTAAELISEAEGRSRALIQDARAAAEGIRAEGLEIVANLREMGNSLRSNAQRLLGDVQQIHSRMLAEVDEKEAALGLAPARARPRDRPVPPDDGDALDVPEFIPPA